LVRLGALRCFFAFGAVPRSARLAAVRVSFQHPGHAQCAPCAIEAADAMLSAPNCPMHSIVLWYTWLQNEHSIAVPRPVHMCKGPQKKKQGTKKQSRQKTTGFPFLSFFFFF
jgi:hypothetical protein